MNLSYQKSMTHQTASLNCNGNCETYQVRKEVSAILVMEKTSSFSSFKALIADNDKAMNTTSFPLHYGIAWYLFSKITSFMGPTWGPSGADRTQVGPMLARWILLSGLLAAAFCCIFITYMVIKRRAFFVHLVLCMEYPLVTWPFFCRSNWL